MKISYLWLKEFINTDLSVKKLTEYLTSLGLEVTSVESLDLVLKENFNGVIIGEIINQRDYCNNFNIKLVDVKISKDQIIQIFSRAYNIILNTKVAVAKKNTNIFFKTSLYHFENYYLNQYNVSAILCSEFDLGIGRDYYKLKIFDSSLEVGTVLDNYIYTEKDFIFNIEITPNRSDAISHFGVARDLYAILSYNKEKVNFFQPYYKKKIFLNSNKISFIANIETPNLCQRYSAILLNNINISVSPIWLQNRLKSIGIDSINNIIDICNYVMYTLGQPLEVFDFNSIVNNTIINIGYADVNTKFIGIDGVERNLFGKELIVKDGNNTPLCIAGILVSAKHQINVDTHSILLQASCLNSISIRQTRKMHSINNDSVFRFERGVDPNLTLLALELAFDLICQNSYNSEIVFFIDKCSNPIVNKKILFRYKKMYDLLGYIIPHEEIKQIFLLLNINIVNEYYDSIEVEVEPCRTDVTREIDLIEEVLRIYGYNSVPVINKMQFSKSKMNLDQFWEIESQLANFLIFNGFYEVINNSLMSIDKSIIGRIELLNPLSHDLGMLRNSLIINLLNNISFNLNYQESSIKFFEFGKIYLQKQYKFFECNLLSLVISGKLHYGNWITDSTKVSFFDLKGIVEKILDLLGINNYIEQCFCDEVYDKGIQFLKNNLIIVQLGILNNNLCISKNIKQNVYASDFYLDIIKKLLIKNKKIVKFSKFPMSKRDLSLIIDKNITYYEIKNLVLNTENKLLKNIELIDVYQGENIPENKKSYTISLYIQDHNKNLTDKEIDNCIKQIFNHISSKTNAILRNI